MKEVKSDKLEVKRERREGPRGRAVKLWVLLATAFFWGTALLAQELLRGQVMHRVVCAAAPAYIYAQYLPSTYTPERKWPVVFCFDPAGAGERPVQLLEKAAETYGFILMGSRDSRNGPLEPILKAQNALWKEARSRFALEDGRCYAAGFSGGARAAIRMALDHPGAFAGVLCCGAVLPDDRSLPKTLPFVVYAAAGTEDFNLFELYEADRELTKEGTTHWVEIFAGPHRWAPPEILKEGVEFFRACAVRKGQAAADPNWEKGVVESRLASANILKASGELLPALWKVRQTAAFFAGVPGADRAAAEEEALEADPQLQARLEAERKLETALDRLRHCESLEEFEREFAVMKKLSQGDGWAAERGRWVLTVAALDFSTSGLASFRRANYKTAAALFEMAARADPKSPLPVYNAACAYSRLNRRKESIAMLQRALDLGFTNERALADDPDLANARKDPAFKGLAIHHPIQTR